MSWCTNPREHEHEGRDDFRSGGRHGADDERMGNRMSDDCDDAYARGFERDIAEMEVPL